MLALLLIALLSLVRSAYAAPCCGAGSAAPTILTGDDRAQLSASISHSQVIGDAPAVGLPVFRADGDDERTQTLRIEGALLLSDRWQVGASLPLMLRSRETATLDSTSASGLGDVSLSGTYEVLPEWEYSVWKPRGYVFAQMGIPTGNSIHESTFGANDPWGLDSRGRGFYSAGGGALLLKGWGDWDSSLMLEIHRAFARTFSTFDGDLKLSPGWGGSIALGLGYSLTQLPIRMGLALSPVYESSILTQTPSDTDSISARQLIWNTSAQLGWLVTRSSTLSAVYTDQTLLGPARNVSLSRSVALLYQRRWER